MEKYNYYEAVTNDIKNYIKDNEIVVTSENEDEVYDELLDKLWTEDSVTGNGSGSYTFNRWTAEENLCHNLSLVEDALNSFGRGEDKLLKLDPETLDVTIRCYILDECLGNALDDIIPF